MQRQKDEVKSRILNAAKAEFCEKSYEGASMRDIAKNAGTSLGNLYRYYENKDQLYSDVVTPVQDQCIMWLGRTFDLSPMGLEMTATLMARFGIENREMFDLLCRGPAEHYNSFLSRFSACISEELRKFVEKEMPGEELGILNPSFFDSLGVGFMSSLRGIMEHMESAETTKQYILELLRFTFSDLPERLRKLNRQ